MRLANYGYSCAGCGATARYSEMLGRDWADHLPGCTEGDK